MWAVAYMELRVTINLPKRTTDAGVREGQKGKPWGHGMLLWLMPKTVIKKLKWQDRKEATGNQSAYTLHSHDVNEGSKHRVDLNC